MSAISDDLMSASVLSDPHSYYHRLRAADPVHWNDLWGGWILTRYVDVVDVLRDAERFSSDRMSYLARELSPTEQEKYRPIFDVLSQWMVFRDPPDHTRLRLLLNSRFTPRVVERYRERVRAIVADLLKPIEAKRQVDIVREFAYLVPLTVILELLGAPELDRDLIKHWSEQLGVFFFLRADEPRRRAIACEGVTSLVEYLKPLIADRTARPRADLTSELVLARKEGRISEQEVLATCVLLVFGGHETTMNLIANGTLAFCRFPEEWMRLKAQPQLIGPAVEELLRYDSSVKATVRWAKVDAQIAGRSIRAGDKILLCLSAANRDPSQFPEPDRLNITRDPNPHVAFAHGIHVCLGAPLARLEGQEAFAGLTRRLPPPQLLEPMLEYHPTVVSRALRSLHVRF